MYTDAILYFPSYSSFVEAAEQTAPDILTGKDEINVFARTPTVQKDDELLVYVRVTDRQQIQMQSFVMNGLIKVLASAEYSTSAPDEVYQKVFDDSEASEIYNRIYDHSPQTLVDSETGEEYTIEKPQRFGQLA